MKQTITYEDIMELMRLYPNLGMEQAKEKLKFLSINAWRHIKPLQDEHDIIMTLTREQVNEAIGRLAQLQPTFFRPKTLAFGDVKRGDYHIVFGNDKNYHYWRQVYNQQQTAKDE